MQQSRLELVNLDQPLRWKKPRGIFVCSMTDLFGEFVPPEMVASVLDVCVEADWHRFALLTKRFDQMLFRVGLNQTRFFNQPHIWWGMTVGHQKAADEALPYMRRMRELLGPNAILWVSYEPALEAVNWKGWECINWLVIGGESGSKARSFNPMWGLDAIQWALDNGIAPYFKQLGSNPAADHFYGWSITGKGDRPEEWPDWLNVREFPVPPTMEDR